MQTDTAKTKPADSITVKPTFQDSLPKDADAQDTSIRQNTGKKISLGGPRVDTTVVPKVVAVDTVREPRVVLKDTVKHKPGLFERKHSPTTAVLLSMAVPGLGQIYNGKHWYWKVPLIYGGFAGLGYAIVTSAKKHNQFSNAYRAAVNSDSISVVVIDGSRYTEANLLNFKTYYKRNLDISVIFTVVLYTLNIIDAAVYGHLFYFDKEINQKVSLHMEPVYDFNFAQGQGFVGMKLNLRL